jgi:hypothetical protein
VEALPGEPPLYERWQLDEPGAAPALPAANDPAALLAARPAPEGARVIPALFGKAAEPAAGEADSSDREPGGEDGPGGDVPF